METRRNVPPGRLTLAVTVGALSSEAPFGEKGPGLGGRPAMSSERQEQKPKEMTSSHSPRGTKLPPVLCEVASVWSRSL